MTFLVPPVGGKKISHVSQGRDQKRSGASERLVDVEIFGFVTMQLQPGDRVLGELSGRAVRPEPFSGRRRDESILVNEGQVVGRDVGKIDPALKALPSREESGRHRLGAGSQNGGQGIVGLNGAKNGCQVGRIPTPGVRVPAVLQYLRGQQSKYGAKQPLAVDARGSRRCVECLVQETVELEMNLTFDRGHQADIDEVELIVLVYGANRLCAMNGVGTPFILVLLEQCRHGVYGQTLTDERRRVAAHLPQGDLLVLDDEQKRRTKRSMRLDQFRRIVVTSRDGGEGGGPV